MKSLKNILVDKNITIKELSTKTGIPATTLYSLADKPVGHMKLDMLRIIASALNMNLWDMEINWSNRTPEEITADFTNQGGSFYGKEAPQEVTDKFLQRITGPKAEISRKMDLLNNEGQKVAVKQVELLTKIPEYRKDEG